MLLWVISGPCGSGCLEHPQTPIGLRGAGVAEIEPRRITGECSLYLSFYSLQGGVCVSINIWDCFDKASTNIVLDRRVLFFLECYSGIF